MAYYDKFVKDPDETLREVASRRNLSTDEFARRVDSISAEAQSGRHLTLGQLKAFTADPKEPDRDLMSHLNACIYCQGMADALSPEKIDWNLEDLKRKIVRSREGELEATAGDAGSRAFFPVGALASLLIAFVGLSGFSGIYAYRARNHVFSLEAEVNELNIKNDALTLQMFDINKHLAALNVTGSSSPDKPVVQNPADPRFAALEGVKVSMPADPVTWYASDGNHVYVPRCATSGSTESSKGSTMDRTSHKCELVVAGSAAMYRAQP